MLILVFLPSISTLLLLTKYFPSGTKRLMLHDDNIMPTRKSRMI